MADLSDAEIGDLWKLRDTLFEQFRGRDTKWENRRKVRYRRMEGALKKLPLNPRISDSALMVHQTEIPNQDCHKRVKRLIANKPRFEVILFDSTPEAQSLGQRLEDGLKALYRWMARGRPDTEWQVVQYQQGDGLGLLKIDFTPDHGASLADYDLDSLSEGDEEDREDEGAVRRNGARGAFRKALKETGREDEAYSKVTDQALRAELPPFRMSAIDPLVCAWWPDGDGIAIIAESGKKSLHPLLETFTRAGYTLKLTEGKDRIVLTGDGSDAVSARTVPDYTQGVRDLSLEVEFTEIRTRDQIAILIEHPKIKKVKGQKPTGRDRGVVLRFPNPFGPYTTGYALVPGDVTTEATPEDEYQPPILGLLSLAQAENVLMTAQLSAALEEALTPSYVKVAPETPVPATDESKAPDVQEGREIPTIAGEIKRVEAPKASVAEVEKRILAEQVQYQFQETLVGGAASEASGHRLAIQVAQADIQSVPYQNARADAITELMKGIVYAVRKHGLAVYIPTLPDSRRTGKQLQVAEPAVITPEMADLNFGLITTLGAETPVTKYAKWQALAQREEQGTVGYQTLVEQSDVEDPEEEIGRVFEGKLLKATMEQVLPALVGMVLKNALAKLAPALPPQPGDGQMPTGVPPGTGVAQGGGGMPDADDMVRLPGVNSPVVQSTTEYGPSVPEPTEIGRVPPS